MSVLLFVITNFAVFNEENKENCFFPFVSINLTTISFRGFKMIMRNILFYPQDLFSDQLFICSSIKELR